MLITLSKSPYYCDLQSLLRITQIGDDLLLISDGVIAGISNTYIFDQLNKYGLILYALKNDVIARGLLSYFDKSISIIDYNDFVQLTVNNKQQISW
ncbi:MAG: sulfurtransferase complex subunit TusB [Enterobacterales bacterium]